MAKGNIVIKIDATEAARKVKEALNEVCKLCKRIPSCCIKSTKSDNSEEHF
ncbi:hypothetical protein KAR91_41390 [Candidatus Pacearchaeota archaeon]|nr:hypothetical protein [Candidatus Pacearchaeota archaeon]